MFARLTRAHFVLAVAVRDEAIACAVDERAIHDARQPVPLAHAVPVGAVHDPVSGMLQRLR